MGLSDDPNGATAVLQGITLQLPIFGHKEKGGKSFSPKTSYNLLLELQRRRYHTEVYQVPQLSHTQHSNLPTFSPELEVSQNQMIAE